jgi:hypothetical protein
MSKLRKWLTGAEVIKLLDISILDLIGLAQDGKLHAHNHLTGEHVEIGNHPLSFLADDGFAGSPIKRIPGGYAFVRDEERKSIVLPEKIESCAFLITEVNDLKGAQPKIKRQNADKWNMVRKYVAEEWEKNPDITIIDIGRSDEVTKILGKNYHNKTIRKQIKDLCPNRSPGARPKPRKT